MSLFAFSLSTVLSQDNSGVIDTLLAKADSMKSANPADFSRLVAQAGLYQDELSSPQQDYYRYLKAYESGNQGKIEEAVRRYQSLEAETDNALFRYRASLSLVNLFALTKNWGEGFVYLEKITQNAELIEDMETRQQGLLVAIIFYNELELYSKSLEIIERLAGEKLTGRNLCTVMTVQLKAKLSSRKLERVAENGASVVDICRQNQEQVIANVSNTYLAYHYLDLDQPEKVITLLAPEFDQVKATNHQLSIMETAGLLAQAYFDTGDFALAEDFALKVSSQSNSDDYVKIAIRAHEILSKIALQDGDLLAAYGYQDKYIAFKEQLFEQSKAKQIAVENAKHLVLEKDNQIKLLGKQKEIAELKVKSTKQRLAIWSAAFVCGVLALALVFYRKNSLREIAAQKKLNAELKDLDLLKDRILMNTSHELRTPLNGIIGLSDIILFEYEGKVDEELVNSIRLISRSGARLSLLVNDILDLAQLRAGKMRIEIKTFDLIELLQDVIILCKPMLKANQVKLVFDSTEIELPVTQDPQRLHRVFCNLIGNAVKFTDQGEISVGCSKFNQQFVVEVKDSGAGIPEDKIESVLKGFEQVDNDNNRSREGAGLGLAISKEIVDALGGRLEINSKMGEGTLVRVHLPLQWQAANLES